MKAFYEDDANSRVMPGKKDVLSSRDESNNKVKMRKRLLLDDIDSLCSKLDDSYPNHKILSKILSKLLSVRSLIKTVFGEIVTIVQQTKFTNFLSHFQHFTMTRSSFISGKGFFLEKEVNSLKVTKKAPQSKCNYEVINMLENQLQSFSIHQQRNIVQLHRFKHQKKNLGDGEVIITDDFSKNYSLKHQNEIMSARWTQEQVSFFCAAVYYSKDEVKKHQHYVLCSNDLGHDKDSIYFYNKYIIDDLKEKEIAVKNVHYWADGPSSQFKNPFLFTNLCFMSRMIKQELIGISL